jgi:membrane-associated phospholipid phosphatase
MFVAVGTGLLTSVVAGKALTRGLVGIPPSRRRTTEWLIVAGALGVAVWGYFASDGTLGQRVLVFLLATLPGFLAYLLWRTALASALLALMPLYFAITPGGTPHLPALGLDRALPVRPAWMLVYASLFLCVLLPLLVVRDQLLFRRTLKAFLTVWIIAFVGFLAYPTVAPRPTQVPGDGFLPWFLRLFYTLDTPLNCFPSLHVAQSFVAALACFRVHRGVGYAALVWASLIGVSTLYTKQHYVVDVIAGTAMAIVAYALFLRGHPREAVPEDDRRLAPRRAVTVVGLYGLILAVVFVLYRTGAVVV